MSSYHLESIIRSLTRAEISVLYWKARGLQYGQIALRYWKTVQWVQWHMSSVYKKFGLGDRKLHHTDRWDILHNQGGRIVLQMFGLRPEKLELWPLHGFPPIPLLGQDQGTPQEMPPIEEVLEGVVEESKLEESVEATQPIPVPDPDILALVLADEQEEEQEEQRLEQERLRREESERRRKEKERWDREHEQIPVRPESGQRDQPLLPGPRIRAAIMVTTALAVAACLGLAGLTAIVWWLTRNPPSAPTLQSSPTKPLEASVVPVDATPTLDALMPPTVTPKAFYELNEQAIIVDGVFISVIDRYGLDGYMCNPPEPGFAIRLNVHNTNHSNFLLRFDRLAFHAQDDQGNEYRLVEAGHYDCSNNPGPVQINMSFDGNQYIESAYAGQIPLEASYLIITADWINGKKFVFHYPL